MATLYVASSHSYSGKTLTSLVLGTRWQRQDRRVGYLKPIGLLPMKVGDQGTDEDAEFVARHLRLECSPADLCPVILDRESCPTDADAARGRVQHAFETCSADADVTIVSGTGQVLTRGSSLGLSGVQVAEMLDAKVLLIGKCESSLDADAIVASYRALADRAVGVILNLVPERERNRVWDVVVPALEELGLPILGILPRDPILQSVSVQEIAEATGGRFLCGECAQQELVENFVVGAMGADQALRYFRRTPRKCVITGGDRSDILLAALETPTRCLILTGDLPPSHNVTARAEDLGIPMLLVRDDTLTTVATIEEMLGKMRVREPRKIDHALEQFEAHLELPKLDAALGLS